MATNPTLQDSSTQVGVDGWTWRDGSARAILRDLCMPLASLRLTVVLFALGIVQVLIGTLAQTEETILDVQNHYFHPWIALVPVKVFFPPAWFPDISALSVRIIFGLLGISCSVVAAMLTYSIVRPHRAAMALTTFVGTIGFWTTVSGVIGLRFWFPGGAAIGLMMVINLFAAHLLRFKVQARGVRLWAGLAALAVGALITWLIIAAGHSKDGLQGIPQFEWETLWLWAKVGLTILCLAGVAWAGNAAWQGRYRQLGFWVFALPLALCCFLAFWIWMAGEGAYLGNSGMRILWQLIQGTVAGSVLLAGCVLVFKQRGGIVLIHAGVGLLMFGQFLVSKYAVEAQMVIDEGRTMNYVHDSNEAELAIVDHSDQREDEVTVVPGNLLRRGGTLQDELLPFDVTVEEFMPNTQYQDTRAGSIMLPTVAAAGSEFENLATAGLGLELAAIKAPPISGADPDQTVNYPSTYVTLTEKASGRELGTYLLSLLLTSEQKVEVDDQPYYVSLRFKRTYKPYNVRLVDVRKENYLGTNTPRNYSSTIHLVDKTTGADRQTTIWMNNPLRYAGETFYQSGYHASPDGTETTTLQLVTNMGWMIPYVACMLVGTGLLAHFLTSLLRFLRRGSAGRALDWREEWKAEITGSHGKQRARLALIFPPAVLALGMLWVLVTLRPSGDSPGEPQIHRGGTIPVVYQGRVKPFDTLARNSLRIISGKETYKDALGRRQPAIRWLFDVISHSGDAIRHKVFRIENFEVLETLGLSRRKGFRYAYEEFDDQLPEFKRQVQIARGLDKKQLSTFQRKLLKLDSGVELFLALRESHRLPDSSDGTMDVERQLKLLNLGAELADSRAPRSVPTTQSQRSWAPLSTAAMGDWLRDTAAREKIRDTRGMSAKFADAFFTSEQVDELVNLEIIRMSEQIIRANDPSILPDVLRRRARQVAENMPAHIRETIEPAARRAVEDQRRHFMMNVTAMLNALVGSEQLDDQANPVSKALSNALLAYREGNFESFNGHLADYESALKEVAPPELKSSGKFTDRVITSAFGSFYAFESYFNDVGAFNTAAWLYLVAFLLSVLAWLGWSGPLNRAAFWLIVFTFAVHTVALAARIYISGRPPVTNLYSSAVFIGWGCVLMGIALELFYRLGLGSIVASVAGFGTLGVAYALAGDGDTFTVLQAVLDTQFWLATHVVCITLGYSATFLAGALGVAYLVRGLLTRSLSPALAKEYARMIYGSLCFAIFFSFVGTVLGGLWADDSWGRFWGWDPKENGALIIVLWNALVLHARWGGMIRQRGLAVLAVCGNVTTAWSWFGVNELNVGLHTYGFTEGRLLWLGLFVGSQILLIVAGCLPKAFWRSYQDDNIPTAQVA